MKYIRTESGIYEVVKSNSRSTEFIYPTKTGIRFCYRQNNKCKFADTVEELCDVVVAKYNYENLPKVVETMKNSKMQIINALKDNKTVEWIKLGIYTDKGLIYVAKMNEKGELELL